MKSPTQRTLNQLRAEGWTCQITEKWNQFAKVRQDLYGFCDVLAMAPTRGILAVQATSGSNFSARVDKIKQEPRAGIWLASGGRIQVHGWSKQGPRGKRKVWTLRTLEIVREGLDSTAPQVSQRMQPFLPQSADCHQSTAERH